MFQVMIVNIAPPGQSAEKGCSVECGVTPAEAVVFAAWIAGPAYECTVLSARRDLAVLLAAEGLPASCHGRDHARRRGVPGRPIQGHGFPYAARRQVLPGVTGLVCRLLGVARSSRGLIPAEVTLAVAYAGGWSSTDC